jgi:hypothetical protein
MIKTLLIIILSLYLGGCSGKYYDTMRDTNSDIAMFNSEIAQACAEALKLATTPEATVAIALTVCRDRIPLMEVEAPEKVSDIAREGVYGIVGYGLTRALSGGSTTNTAGRDYVNVNGSGQAGGATTHPTTFIMAE